MEGQEGVTHRFTVNETEGGIRLDIFLAARDPAFSRSQIKRAVEEQRVAVNGSAVKPGYRLRVGDTVLLKTEPPKDSGIVPEAIPLSVVFEDEFLIVIDKPAGMVVHPGAGNPAGTLVNALLSHCGDLSGIGGYIRPGIVHRLDKNTSGLMVAAKTDQVHRALADQFKNRTVTKIYQAIVYGTFRDDEGIIESAIGRHPVDRKKMSTAGRRGKPALTRWKIRETFKGATLLDARIETGRTHQIRVHLSTIGHPVVGDSEYGGTKKRLAAIADPKVRRALSLMNRQALHAGQLGFFHPHRNAFMKFAAPLPDDMKAVVEGLRRAAPQPSGV